MELNYKYEVIAATLPPISQVTKPRDGDRATNGNVILVWCNGEWRYW